MIYLKKFVLELAEEKELKLHNYTKEDIRDVEREMEKNRKEIDSVKVVSELKKNNELKKGFGGDDWAKIGKEVSRMK